MMKNPEGRYSVVCRVTVVTYFDIKWVEANKMQQKSQYRRVVEMKRKLDMKIHIHLSAMMSI